MIQITVYSRHYFKRSHLIINRLIIDVKSLHKNLFLQVILLDLATGKILQVCCNMVVLARTCKISPLARSYQDIL
jgi:hypothetical protein